MNITLKQEEDNFLEVDLKAYLSLPTSFSSQATHSVWYGVT
jgi:hypothetical protein